MANPNSEARLGYGAKILMGDGSSPQVFAEIGEIGDFEDGDTVGLIEATNHQSPGFRKEYIADLIDGDEISFPVNYIPTHATHNRTTGLRGKLRQRVDFRIEMPGETEGVEFEALVIGVSRSAPVAGIMQMTVTLKKTGEPSYYAVV
jgi:hypothetical protein